PSPLPYTTLFRSRLVRRAPGGTPQDHGQVCVLRTPDLRTRRVLPQAVELAHPLLVHLPPLLDEFREAREDVGDQLPALHMFVRRPDELESLRPGQRPRAHAALR